MSSIATKEISLSELQSNIAKVSAEFATNRLERQLRRSLVQEDFDKIRAAGYLMLSVPKKWVGYTLTLKKR